MAFFGLIGNDQELAREYANRESASDRAHRKRVEGHRRNLVKNTRKGQAWEDGDRLREKRRIRGW